MLLLVFVHGYNLKNSYLQPFTVTQEPLTFTSFFEYWTANGLFRFRIPMLFIISGYLFAMNDDRPYGQRMRKRLRTLGIPYLLWSAVALLITFAWQQNAVTAQAVKDAMLDQLGDNRPYTEIGFGGIALRWLLVPIAFQLWFIRSLLLYNALYPLFLKAVLKSPKVWFSVIGFFWLASFNFSPFESEGLLFFTLGIFLQKKQFNIESPARWLDPRTWGIVFIVCSVLKTFLAFYYGWSIQSFIVLSLLHKATVFSGLITMWFGFDRLVKFLMNRPWFAWFSAFGFIIYAMHVPLVNYTTALVFRLAAGTENIRLISYLFIPLAVILVCVGFGALLRFLLPKVYSLATGGRGL